MTHEERANWIRRVSLLPVVVMLAALPACDKIRSLKENLGDKTPAAPAKPYAGELVAELTESGFDAFRQQPGRVVLIDFYADWCGPCRRLGPVLHDIAAEKQGLVLVGKVNVDKSPALASGNGVRGIPDIRIFRDGRQVDRFVGMPSPAEVRRKIEKQLEGLPPIPAEAPAPAETKPAEPVTGPMDKDWLPPGMKRR